MSGGGGGTISTSEPRLGALRVQQSSYGLALPIVYGRTRVGGNLIWYGDFVAIAHTTTTQSGGKGGGGVTQQSTSYTYESALMMALCEGPIGGVVSVWQSKKRFEASVTQTAIEQLGLSLATGAVGQATWGHLSANHPAQALGYSSTAHLHSAAFSLGSNAEIDNHSFELDGKLQFGGDIVDANPKDIVYDLLTNPQYGAAFPTSSMGDLSVYGSYCQAMGLFLSPAFTEQQEAREHLKLLTSMTNSACVWSEGKLKLVPYGDEAVSGNGAAYTPNLTPIYDLTDDDYIVTGAEDPVKCDRKTPADAFNQVQVEYLNRANAYNIEIVEAKDQANIEKFGLRPRDPIKMHAICDAAVARRAAQLQLQRSLYVRNEYEFRLGWKYCLLEPMDLVTLTDEGLGLSKTPVRIIDVQEDAEGLLTIRAEDYPFGVASATLYPTQSGTGFAHDYNASPGPVVAPAFFERRNAQALVVGAAVTGQTAMWGGCQIWCSLDGSTYKFVNSIRGGARYGTLVSDAAAGPGAALSVQLAGNGGVLLSGTSEEADLFFTECYVGGEFVAYETATLVATNRYTLSGLRRAGYGSTDQMHAEASTFIRIDDAIVDSEALDASMIGKTIYFKFIGFNLFGGGLEDIASVTAYPYVVTGNGALSDIYNIITTETLVVAAGAVVNKVHVEWLVSGNFSHASLAWRINGGAWTTLPDIYGKTADLILSESGRLELAITPWGAVQGQVVYHATTVFGKTAAPANVTGLAINLAGRQAVLSWSPSTDLDVLVGGWLYVRHSPVTSDAIWGNASDLLPSVPGASTSAAVPLKTGSYLARWVDSSGNLSAATATLVVDASVIEQLNVIVSQDEHAAWSGVKTNMTVNSGTLQLTDPSLVGAYRVPTIDLGAVHPARISADLHFAGFFVNDLIDARIALIDTWADFGGALVEDVAAEVWFSATADDPAGTAAWTAWSPLRVATDYAARAYRFEARCASSTPEHNVSIDALTLSVDVDDRTEAGVGVVSGAGATGVSFARPFFAIPAIGVTLNNGASGDWYELTKTLTGFTATFRDASGTAVSRTFDWIAKGY
ncbi:MAG: phage tail protein [Limnohabitans sp.]